MAPATLLQTVLPFAPTYAHLLVAALFPIYTGAHASLCRPQNTLTPKQVRALRPKHSSEDYSDEDEEHEIEAAATPRENLTAQDAMLFPVTAGILLGTLYFLIKYLNDPSLLLTALTYYFCLMGMFAVGKGYADALDVLSRYLFPYQYRDRNGVLFTAGFDSWTAEDGKEYDHSPSPILPLPRALNSVVWALRRELGAKLVVDFTHREKNVKQWLKFGDLCGPFVGAVVVVAYAAGGKHWLLTNIMGISFSYSAMQVISLSVPRAFCSLRESKLLSPTTFPIATLLLGLLFCYDVFFVFFTPLMVTVATSLDVPIKLLFPRPGTSANGGPMLAMLGLGDIVLPGIVIAMALRWDLWRFHEIQRQALLHVAKQSLGELTKEEISVLKPRYHKDADFPKPYFKASMVGYMLGMITTLGVVHVFQHAQPALLYLVPAVLISVWGTALVKGEAKVMWNYTEEGEPDEDAEKKGEDENKEVQKPVVKGEVDRDVIALKVVRRPALGARIVETTGRG